jgi:hypothetical protein
MYSFAAFSDTAVSLKFPVMEFLSFTIPAFVSVAACGAAGISSFLAYLSAASPPSFALSAA